MALDLVAELLGLAKYVGDPPRWGAELAVPAIATDPPAGTLLGERVGNFGSVKLPAPATLNIRWGYWKPAPFSIPGLTLPTGGGGRFRPDTSTGGVTHHDAFRVLMEWGIPNGVSMRQWIGPNQVVSLSAQVLTLSLFRMRRTTLNVIAKSQIGLGQLDPTWGNKAVNSTRSVVSGDAGAGFLPLVGSNWARRGGYVSLDDPGSTAMNVAFCEFAPSAANQGVWVNPLLPTVAIPVDWCGPIWGSTEGVSGQFIIEEHWTAPPEMGPWAATP